MTDWQVFYERTRSAEQKDPFFHMQFQNSSWKYLSYF